MCLCTYVLSFESDENEYNVHQKFIQLFFSINPINCPTLIIGESAPRENQEIYHVTRAIYNQYYNEFVLASTLAYGEFCIGVFY